MPERPASLTTPPDGYAPWLAELQTRIHSAKQRAALAVNRELVLLYWQIGQDILQRQQQQDWGAKVIERLAHDLRVAFPDMRGFSPRNLKYMRAFAQAWPEAEFVQEELARLPWYHQLALLDKLTGPEARRWYAGQIKDEQDNPTIGLLLCKSRNKVVAEYALGDLNDPAGGQTSHEEQADT